MLLPDLPAEVVGMIFAVILMTPSSHIVKVNLSRAYKACHALVQKLSASENKRRKLEIGRLTHNKNSLHLLCSEIVSNGFQKTLHIKTSYFDEKIKFECTALLNSGTLVCGYFTGDIWTFDVLCSPFKIICKMQQEACIIEIMVLPLDAWDRKRIACADIDGRIVIWDTEKAEKMYTLPMQRSAVQGMCISAFHLVSVDQFPYTTESKISFWCLQTSELKRQVQTNQNIKFVTPLRDGTLVLVTSHGNVFFVETSADEELIPGWDQNGLCALIELGNGWIVSSAGEFGETVEVRKRRTNLSDVQHIPCKNVAKLLQLSDERIVMRALDGRITIHDVLQDVEIFTFSSPDFRVNGAFMKNRIDGLYRMVDSSVLIVSLDGCCYRHNHMISGSGYKGIQQLRVNLR